MNRSRPRDPRPRRGRSREPSPERQEEEKSQGPAADEISAEPPPRRSTRNRRGSPIPPPAAVPSMDENDTAANGSHSQAQHAKIKEEAMKTSDGDTLSNGSDTGKSKTAEPGHQGTDEGAQSEPHSTSSTNDQNTSKDVPSHQASSPNLEGNAKGNREAPSQGIPTLSQEIDTFKGDNGASEVKAKVKLSGSKHSNGPGDDHATDGNTASGKKESSKEEEACLGDAKVPAETIGEASAPLTAEKTLTISKTDREVINSSPRGASEQESRTMSLESKSALEVVDMEGNDHEEKVTTSPHLSFNDVSEKAMPFHEKVISVSSDISDKVTHANAHGGESDEKNGAEGTNAPNSKIQAKKNEAPTTAGSKLRTQASIQLSAADNASYSEQSSSARELPNEIRTNCKKPTTSISSEIEKGPGSLPSLDTAKREDTKRTSGDQGSEDDTSRTASVSKNVPREHNDANPISADVKKDQSSMPRFESSASNPTVISDVYAIDIRHTAKVPSKARRFSGGSTVSSSNLKTGKDCIVQVNKGDTVLSDSRKRTSANDGMGIQYSDEAHSKSKRQRREEPAGILSSSVLQASTRRGKARKSRRRRGRTISREDQGDRLSGLTDVENVKLQLYDIACRVHRGKGPERRFASYWEALCQFLRFQIHQGPNTIISSLDGVHDVLNSFLITKQMRKLHNLLVMGLLSQCLKDSVEEKDLREAVPGEWRMRVQNARDDDLPVAKDLDVSLVRPPEIAFDLGDFDVQSDLWTAAGREPLTAHSSGVAETDDSRISGREVTQLHRHEPRLPGALTIDPLVRGIVHDECGLKVSENAIWLLIVAARQYTETVVKNTVSNLESIRCEHSLEPLEFAPCAARTVNMRTPKSKTKGSGGKNDSGKKQTSTNPKTPKTPEKKASAGEKRRRVTPLDIAAALNGGHLSQDCRSLAGSVSSLASVRCYQSSFNGSQPAVPLLLDSVQSFLVERIETAAKRPRHEWRDPEAVPVAPVAPKPRQQSPQKKSSITPKPGGLRQESRKGAALQPKPVQGGGTAKATTTARPSLAPFAGYEARPVATMTTPSPRISKTPPAISVPRGGNAAVSPPPPPPPTGVRDSPPSASPRGRGRGFGVKDLAAMRARTGSTPPKQVGTSPAPGRESNPSSGAEQQATPTMQQENGAGKELRRLQQVQGEKNDSLAAASGNAMPGMIPAVPVAGQPESMDTTQ